MVETVLPCAWLLLRKYICGQSNNYLFSLLLKGGPAWDSNLGLLGMSQDWTIENVLLRPLSHHGWLFIIISFCVFWFTLKVYSSTLEKCKEIYFINYYILKELLSTAMSANSNNNCYIDLNICHQFL